MSRSSTRIAIGSVAVSKETKLARLCVGDRAEAKPDGLLRAYHRPHRNTSDARGISVSNAGGFHAGVAQR